ncbi:MAG: DUF5916 domain-containing protein [Bacteroidota bacterium]
MMKRILIALCLLVLGNHLLLSQSAATTDSTQTNAVTKKIYLTKRMESKPPTIDGLIDEAVWETVSWGGGFTQRQPNPGGAPTEETNFKILYDAKNLYVAFRCFDADPDGIERRLSRRDGFAGDWVEINIDSYHDLRTAFSFTISASGVKGDEFISNDGNNWDSSWDPIWYVRTQVDEAGWTAELRIPLSQLRFSNKTDEQVWGIQFTRRYFREEERSVWQYLPPNSAQWVSAFGELHGIKGIRAQKQVEVLPYVVGKAETFEQEEGNPFATGNRLGLNVGVDGKIGITNDLTLDFTINPDFGQVEADPSALVLDGFQVFFQERRPFFVGNRNIFDFRVTSAESGGSFTSDILFYSRRIGGSPHGYPDVGDGEFVNQPQNTAILGAAKFSGKTQKGLSVGVLESVTRREWAEIDNQGERRRELVEPLTNYFVGRVQQDYDGGNTVIGGMLTAVNRNLAGTELNFLHRSANSAGLDLMHRWKEQTWYVAANLIGSNVEGSREAITNTQERFHHNFQRVDAEHLSVDTTRTSLLGHGGTLRLGRVGGGKRFNFEGGVTWRSPELELNDIGFLRNTDQISHFFWAGYRIDQPFSIFRNVRFNYNHFYDQDFSGQLLRTAWNVNGHAQFKNNSGMGTGFNIIPYDVSTKSLRGGPSLRHGNRMNNWTYFYTDGRKKVRFNFNAWHQWGMDNGNWASSYSVWMTANPTNALQLSIGTSVDSNHDRLQYVENVDLDDDETRYLNATIDQKTFSMTINVDYTINPNLTVQYYGSPFISRGRYSDFKHVTDPMNRRFEDRFQAYANNEVEYNVEEAAYHFFENGEEVFTSSDPDFNFMQFRSNLVIRWEYIPGSEVFLVWSQSNTNNGNPQDRLIPSLWDNLFTEKAYNTFLIKYTYRFRR